MNRRDQYVPDKAASGTHKMTVGMTAYTILEHVQARRSTMAMGSGHSRETVAAESCCETLFFKSVATDRFTTLHIHEYMDIKIGLMGEQKRGQAKLSG